MSWTINGKLLMPKGWLLEVGGLCSVQG